MLALTLGLVAGAWWVQQQPSLLSGLALLLAWLVLVTVAVLFNRLIVNQPQSYPLFSHSLQHVYQERHSLHFWGVSVVKYAAILAVALLIGISWATLRAHLRLSDELPHAWEQKTITLVGVVASLPELSEHGERFTFNVEQVLTPAAKVPSKLSLSYYYKALADDSPPNISSAPAQKQFHAGERWQLSVRLKRPHTTYNPHGFDFEAWALSEGIRATGTVRHKSGLRKLDDLVWQPKYLIAQLREQIDTRLANTLAKQPYAGVIRALVIGEDNLISAQDWTVFLRTGTNHLMSISGLHITMLSGLVFTLVYWVWRKVPALVLRLPARKAASLAGMLMAMLYAALAGFSVPTQRTLYMLMVVTLVLLSGRRFAFTHVLSIALLTVVILDPWAVLAPGFWLSFGAIAVIAYVVSARIAAPHWLAAAIKVQWAVTLGLIPMLLIMFGQVSVVSPLANAFAIPVISFIVVPFAMLGSVLPVDGLLQFSHQVLALCMHVLEWMSAWSWATWQQAAPTPLAMLLAMAGILWMLMPRGVPLRMLGALWLIPLFFPVAERPVYGEMHATILDVGQGLSVVVQTATHTLLYDAGSSFSAQSDAGNRVIVPFLRGQGIHQLDGAVVSHDDIDHAGGMPSVFAQLPVAWLASSLADDALLFTTPAWQATLPKERMKCFAGQNWHWDGVKFEVLYPDLTSYDDAEMKDNDRSCVIKVSSESGSLLLTGDIEKAAENALLANETDLQSDVLISPHHGSKTSSSVAFLQAVQASHVAITNGYLNRFGHPKPMIEQRYLAQLSKVYRSDYHGALQIRFSSKQTIQVNAWRNVHPKYWHDHYSSPKRE